MHLAFLKLPLPERNLYFQQTALRRGLHPAIMEKDFWVCWLLGVLFGHRHFRDALVFKGGTSLSKVFGAITRFSEDIDLSLSPAFLGIAEEEVERASSRTQRTRWMERLEEACAIAVRQQIQAQLEAATVGIFGHRSDGQPWIEFVMETTTLSPVLLFHYPTTQAGGFTYLRRMVKMEFGSLTDQRPAGLHSVSPWVAEDLPDSFRDWHCEVVALDVERSYWEKATILHAEYHRAAEERMPERFSRHYADMAALARHPLARRAATRYDLRDRVVAWKERFFARAWARYDLARPGTFRLVPPAGRVRELQADYAAMREMYMTQPPSFDDVLATLRELELAINAKERR